MIVLVGEAMDEYGVEGKLLREIHVQALYDRGMACVKVAWSE